MKISLLLVLTLVVVNSFGFASESGIPSRKERTLGGDGTTFTVEVKNIQNLTTSLKHQKLLPANAPMRVRWSLPLMGPSVRRITMPDESLGLKYILVETNQNDLIAIRRDNGNALWWVKTPEPVTGDVFFGTYSVFFICKGRLVRLNRNTGEVYYTVKLPFSPTAGPTAFEQDEKYSMIFAPASDKIIYGFDVSQDIWPPKSGTGAITQEDFSIELPSVRILWIFGSKGVVNNSLTFFNGWLFSGCWANRVYGINLRGATVQGKPKDFWEFRPRAGVMAPAVVEGPYVLLSSLDNTLYCLSRRHGDLNWRYVAEDKLYKSAQLVKDNFNNEIYIAQKVGENGPLVFVNNKSGQELFRHVKGRKIVGRHSVVVPQINERTIVVTVDEDNKMSGIVISEKETRTEEQKVKDYDNYVYRDIKVKWSMDSSKFKNFARNTYGERVFCATADGSAVIAIELNK